MWHFFPMILILLFWLKYERHSGNLPIKLVYYLFYIIFGWKFCFLIIPRFHFQIYERGLNENHWWPGSKSQKQPSWIVYPQRENHYQRLVSKSSLNPSIQFPPPHPSPKPLPWRDREHLRYVIIILVHTFHPVGLKVLKKERSEIL